jgi:hypothetical protein
MSLLALQERLAEETSVVMKAAEGLSPEARLLTELAETRKKLKSLKELEEDLTTQLKDHIKETGEMVTNGAQVAVLQTRETVKWDEDGLMTVLSKSNWEKCLSFDKKRFDALVTLGEISGIDHLSHKETTYALTIKENK